MSDPHRAAPGRGPVRLADSVTPSLPSRRRRTLNCRLPGRAAALALALTVCLAGGALAQAPSRVTVQPGETLSEIALRYYGDADEAARIATANRILDPDRIFAGVELLLPAGGSGAGGQGTTRRYIIQPGDSLSVIAEKVYGSDSYAASLAAANGIGDANRIHAGQEIVLPVGLASAGSRLADGAAASASRGGLAGRRICIDPGHGGTDPGTAFTFENGRTLRESDVTLDVSLSLAQRLRSQGAIVSLTRQSDATLGLPERAALCNAAGADVTVSVHLNGIDDRSVNGSLALYGKPGERTLAEVLATTLQNGLFGGRGAGANAYGARQFPGRVLLYTAMPAVIVEPAFLTNPLEARALQAPTGDPSSRRAQIVREIERGLSAYLR